MDTYKIAIDTFLAETSEGKASGCAVFSGADMAFKTSSCTRTGTSQSCISWPDTPCFPSPESGTITLDVV